MTQLRQRMIGDMKLRNFGETTIHTYTRVVRDFAGFFHRAPDRLGRLSRSERSAHLQVIAVMPSDGDGRRR